jgi:hypothetical protein
MSDLRSKLIRLAYQRPELRGDLLPILKQASSPIEPKQKPKFDAPAIPPSLIPTNATGWQLYSTMSGANTAAKAIAKSMAFTLQMAGRNITPFNTDAANAKAVSALLSRMSKILQTHREVGASDSEPRYVMLKVLEKYLKMYLDRYDFPKTYGVLDNW